MKETLIHLFIITVLEYYRIICFTSSESSIPKLWVDTQKLCATYWLRSLCETGKENVFVKVWEEDKEKGKQAFVTYVGARMKRWRVFTWKSENITRALSTFAGICLVVGSGF